MVRMPLLFLLLFLAFEALANFRGAHTQVLGKRLEIFLRMRSRGVHAELERRSIPIVNSAQTAEGVDFKYSMVHESSILENLGEVR